MSIKKHKIFVINLDRSVSRWQKIKTCLELQKLPYERFSAIDGKLVDYVVVNTEIVRSIFVNHTPNEVGTYPAYFRLAHFCEQRLENVSLSQSEWMLTYPELTFDFRKRNYRKHHK